MPSGICSVRSRRQTPVRAASLTAVGFDEPLVARIARPLEDALAIYWLGQAGFLIRTPGATLLIDPYLSDSLAEKYRGKLFSHERMMAPPIRIEALAEIDLVLCTHHHTDHMDPGTLAPLALGTNARFVVPAATQDEAMRRAAVGPERLVCADAGDVLEPFPGVVVRPTRAAHERLERDAAGRSVFLGYCIEIGGIRIFHSGDAVPFAGVEDEVRALEADLALLPVNGRSAYLAENGVPGNFFLEEAIALARDCRVPHLIAHHYGMFAFNTIEESEIERQAARLDLGVDFRRAALGLEYVVRRP
jgi:L-ascorbate metabolism protein UlaG (beta-lactamase superfamily)